MKKPIKGESKAIGQIYVRDHGLFCRLEEAREKVIGINGVLSAETNHTSDMLVVEYDSEKVAIDKIRKTIDNES